MAILGHYMDSPMSFRAYGEFHLTNQSLKKKKKQKILYVVLVKIHCGLSCCTIAITFLSSP